MASDSSHSEQADSQRLFDFRSGGWVLLLALLACVSVVLWWSSHLSSESSQIIGDGKHPESYGFDLGNSKMNTQVLVSSGQPKDGIRALSNPPHLLASELPKRIKGRQRVIGVVINGTPRAYPLSILNWHEIVNDSISEIPFAVTYNPLCDSAVVVDRRIGGMDVGDTVEFGVSGLLYNSNMLMYDRRESASEESLWCQLTGEAVAGPYADVNKKLTFLPCELVTWGDWTDRYPDTEVIEGKTLMKKAYKRTPYRSYFGSDILRFPVDPLPEQFAQLLKARIVVFESSQGPVGYFLTTLVNNAKHTGRSELEIDGEVFSYGYRSDPQSVWFRDAEGNPPPVRYGLWFAWYALEENLRSGPTPLLANPLSYSKKLQAKQ